MFGFIVFQNNRRDSFEYSEGKQAHFQIYWRLFIINVRTIKQNLLMKKINLNKVVLPEDSIIFSKTPNKPKNVIFTNRYLYTARQQKIRLAGCISPSKLTETNIFTTSSSNSPEPSRKGSFPVRRSNTNSHNLIYKYRHPTRIITCPKEPQFNFKIQDAYINLDPRQVLSQSARTICSHKAKKNFQANSLVSISRKSSIRQSTIEINNRSPRMKSSYVGQFAKIDGWSTIPLITTSKDMMSC